MTQSSRAAWYVELKTTTSAEPVGSSSLRNTIGSPRFVVSVLEVGDDPADRDDLAVAATLELAEGRVGLPP